MRGEVVPLESGKGRGRARATCLDGGHPQVRRDGTTGPDAAAEDGEIARPIIVAAARGDGEAFAVIMRAYAPRLRATVHQVLRDDQLVDDVLQDVFIAAYRGLPRFRGDAALGTWLHRITYTTCAQYLRRARRRARFAHPATSDRRDPGVADHAESVGDSQRVRDALGRLPAEQRIVVLLVDRDGYDYRAAAKVLGIPRGTVASRLNVARAHLRAALGLDDGRGSEGS